MRTVVCLLIALAAGGDAQWRHFGSEQRSSARPSLARDMLGAHNAVRAHLGLAPLSWSDRLASLSQNWAGVLLRRGKLSHRPNSEYGENLFEISGAAATPSQVVNAWAGESRDYDYKSNQCRGVCGHYTQIVWSRTTHVGCGVARGGGREFWVCEYDPPGNFVGQRPY